MAGFGNFIWFIFGGFIHGLIWLLLAGIFAITIIGLPLARACLEFAKLAAFPFGKSIVRDTDLTNVSQVSKTVSIILNFIWFPFGLIITILYFALAVAFCVTLIGIPFGIAYARMGKFSLFPIGARVISKKQAYAVAVANEIEKRNLVQKKTANKKCRQCNNIYPESKSSCPNCGSSLYEETSEDIKNSIPKVVPVIGSTWVCKKCSESNSANSSSCKGCGEYR